MKSMIAVGSVFFFFQAEDGIRDYKLTGVQTCALPIYPVRADAAIDAIDRLMPEHRRFDHALALQKVARASVVTNGPRHFTQMLHIAFTKNDLAGVVGDELLALLVNGATALFLCGPVVGIDGDAIVEFLRLKSEEMECSAHVHCLSLLSLFLGVVIELFAEVVVGRAPDQ